jgi:hypothetical protein
MEYEDVALRYHYEGGENNMIQVGEEVGAQRPKGMYHLPKNRNRKGYR